MILRDQDGDDGFTASSRASLLTGRSVKTRASTISLPSRSVTCSRCVTPVGGERTEHVRVTDLPYDYALPMLTGWDLYFRTGDNHVAKIGASIRNLVFDRVTHTLEYDFVHNLADQDASPEHGWQRGVTILGFDRTSDVTSPIGPQPTGPLGDGLR